jgi:hypothetical protein
MATLKYEGGRMAFVYNDFDNPRKGRVIEIIGMLPEGERFQTSVTLHVDITDLREKYAEHAPHIRNGLQIWQGCLDETKKNRSGLGRLIMNEALPDKDAFGTQFKAFLDWAETGKKPAAVATFADQLRSEKLIDAVNLSLAKDAEVRYKDGDYV